MLITISGTQGAGKGTVAEILGRKLKLPVYSAGDFRRAAAKRRGMTLEEYNRYGERHPETDHDADRWQALLAKKLGRGIFEGRMSFRFIPNSKKIFLFCSMAEAARRLYRDRNPKRKYEADFSSPSRAMAAVRRRRITDQKRYWRYYRINFMNRKHYDLVVSTTNLTPNQAAERILHFVKRG